VGDGGGDVGDYGGGFGVVLVVVTTKTKTIVLSKQCKILISDLGHLRNNINCVIFHYCITFPIFPVLKFISY
jgi:hypothetical protein